MNRKYKLDVEIIDEIPEGAARTAESRTRPILRHWFISGAYNLEMLARSLYLQGVTDGVAAVEKAELGPR